MPQQAAPPIARDADRLIERALDALAPDHLHRARVTRTLRSIASMVNAEDLEALVESVELASGDLNRRLLLERYGSVTRRV